MTDRLLSKDTLVRGRDENTFLTTLSTTNDLSAKLKKMKSDFTDLCENDR